MSEKESPVIAITLSINEAIAIYKDIQNNVNDSDLSEEFVNLYNIVHKVARGNWRELIKTKKKNIYDIDF